MSLCTACTVKTLVFVLTAFVSRAVLTAQAGLMVKLSSCALFSVNAVELLSQLVKF